MVNVYLKFPANFTSNETPVPKLFVVSKYAGGMNQNVTDRKTAYHYKYSKHKWIPFYPRCEGKLCKRYPHFMIIGGRKCGTGALKSFLALHPSLVSQGGFNNERKENNYFLDRKLIKRDIRYLNSMPLSKNNQLTYEKSIYFNPSRNSALHIREFCDRYNISMKFILLVREPVQRMISHFTQLQLNLNQYKKMSLSYALRHKRNKKHLHLLVDEGNYYAEMKRWLKYFSLGQFLILDGEAFAKDPLPVLSQVEKFLKIEHKFNDDIFYFDKTKGFHCFRIPSTEADVIKNISKCLSDKKGRPHPKQPKKLIQKWIKYFQPLSRQFFSLVNVKFNWTQAEKKLLQGAD